MLISCSSVQYFEPRETRVQTNVTIATPTDGLQQTWYVIFLWHVTHHASRFGRMFTVREASLEFLAPHFFALRFCADWCCLLRLKNLCCSLLSVQVTDGAFLHGRINIREISCVKNPRMDSASSPRKNPLGSIIEL